MIDQIEHGRVVCSFQNTTNGYIAFKCRQECPEKFVFLFYSCRTLLSRIVFIFETDSYDWYAFQKHLTRHPADNSNSATTTLETHFDFQKHIHWTNVSQGQQNDNRNNCTTETSTSRLAPPRIRGLSEQIMFPRKRDCKLKNKDVHIEGNSEKSLQHLSSSATGNSNSQRVNKRGEVAFFQSANSRSRSWDLQHKYRACKHVREMQLWTAVPSQNGYFAIASGWT